jgi:PAS domain S-box-containing protein
LRRSSPPSSSKPASSDILDAASDALIITDQAGSVLWLNRAATTTFGLDGARTIGDRLAALGGPGRLLDQTVEVSGPAGGTELRLALTVTRASKSPLRYAAWVRERSDGESEKLEARTLVERVEEAAGLGSWEWNTETDELLWSDNHYRLWGLKVGEIRPSLEYVVEHTHPDDRARVQRYVAALVPAGKRSQIEYRAIRADGTLRHFLSAVAVVDTPDDGPTRVVGSIQDITERRRAEREVTAHVAVSMALAEWQGLEEGAAALVRGLAEALDFVAGGFWVAADGELACHVFWHDSSSAFEPFEAETRRLRLRRGEGLVGHAWESRKPINWTDVVGEHRFVGADAAEATGMRGALAVPAMYGDEVLAVIDLYSREQVALPSLLMQSLTGVGHEIGQFLDRHRGELAPPTLTPRELEVLQHAARGKSGPEIAETLVLSPATVKTHFENIYRKLGVSDRATAVAHALRLGFID